MPSNSTEQMILNNSVTSVSSSFSMAQYANTIDIPSPSYLEINLKTLVKNFEVLQRHVGDGVTVVPTIKADAYGHGAVRVAQALTQYANVRMFAVASLSEALPLRRAGIVTPILVMSYIPVEQINHARLLGITCTVYDTDLVQEYAQELLRCTTDQKPITANGSAETAPLTVHMKIDSGMGRFGALPEDASQLYNQLKEYDELFNVEGIYTHYSCADDNLDFTILQQTRFKEVVEHLESRGSSFKYMHSGNSAATLLGAKYVGNLARCGIALYGCTPGPDRPLLPDMKLAVRWITSIGQVKCLPADHAIGYGNTYTTTETEWVAMLPVGYKDGLRRGPQNWGEVLIRGTRCPIRGRISMEKTVVSVQHLIDPEHPKCSPVKVGEEVVLLGQQQTECITPEQVGMKIGTINYEVLTGMIPREARIAPNVVYIE